MRPDATRAAQDVCDVVTAVDAAFNRGDVEALLGFYDPEALLVERPGVCVQGHPALRAVFQRLVQQAGGAQVLRSRVLVAQDTALFLARWSIRRAGSASPETHTATSVLRRQADGHWRLLIDNAFGPQGLLQEAP